MKRIIHIINLFLHYFLYYIGRIFSNGIVRVYYWKKHQNFGDLLTPALLRHYGITPIYFQPHRAQVIAIGSLIEHIKNDYNGIILGTGAIEETTRIRFPKAKVLGVRGKLTQNLLNIKNEIILGDPGLLVSKLINIRSSKKYKLGIIPHYFDWGNPKIMQLYNNYPKEITIINVQNEPISVIKNIDECENILSSSLHGLISADSLGVPNRWIHLSPLLGGDFKFRDYYTVFGIEASPYFLTGDETLNELIDLTQCVPKEKVDFICDRLDETFRGLKQLL